jgi:N-acetylmuramic acid 6-phosphate etherase
MRTKPILFKQLKALNTEQQNLKTFSLDQMSTWEILETINKEDRVVARAVKDEIRYISKAIDLVIKSFQKGGRLIYIGAGTSGRLGVLDAAECPPTFGTSPSMVKAIIAGGAKAVFRSQEGSEDESHTAAKSIKKLNVSEKDVVCGIAASVRTPFVRAGLREAKRRKAHTILVTTNPRSVLRREEFRLFTKGIDVTICLDVGPEVIMGSTRMKSGTAQKMVLNMITTTAMIKLGKVYENMMVDLKMNSKKLEERAKRVVMIVTEVDYRTASNVLRKADGHVKTAIIMIKKNVSSEIARRYLREANGFVREAINRKKIS